MGSKREAVVIGAGKMGRGFCAEILASAGCHLTFVDSDETRVERLLHAGSYTIYKARKTYLRPSQSRGSTRSPSAARGRSRTLWRAAASL